MHSFPAKWVPDLLGLRSERLDEWFDLHSKIRSKTNKELCSHVWVVSGCGVLMPKSQWFLAWLWPLA
jgi:hypothetical protein